MRRWMAADQANGFRFLEKHVFYPSLRGTVFDLASFEGRLGALADAQLASYGDAVPDAWREGHALCDQISAYLHEAREERTGLVGFVKHLLR